MTLGIWRADLRQEVKGHLAIEKRWLQWPRIQQFGGLPGQFTDGFAPLCRHRQISGNVNALDIQRVNVTANLAVSAQGREAVSELARQTAELLNARPLEPTFFDRQMAFNLLAQVGTPDAQGHTALEKRLVHELRAVLDLPLLKISATCVQAPVFFGDSLTVSLQLGAPVDLAAVNRILDTSPGIELVEEGDYPTAVGDAVGQDVVYVGRVRAGVDDPAELNLWLTSDNVRKGAALNAVQLAQLLIKGLV